MQQISCFLFLFIAFVSILNAQEKAKESEFLLVSVSDTDTSLTYPFTKKYESREVTRTLHDLLIYKVWQNTASPTLFEEYIQINDTLFDYTQYDNNSDKIKRSGYLRITTTQYSRSTNVTVTGLTPEEYPEKRFYVLEKTGYWREGSMSNRKGGQYIKNKREGTWKQYARGRQIREQIYQADSFIQEIQTENELYKFNDIQELTNEIKGEYNLELASGLFDNVVFFHPKQPIEVEPIDTISTRNILIVDNEEEEEEEIICSYYIVNMDLAEDKTVQLTYEPNRQERRKTFNGTYFFSKSNHEYYLNILLDNQQQFKGKLLFSSEMWFLIEFESNFVMRLEEL